MVIRALDRKLVRDLAQMRAQAMAIALVVASGVAVFVSTVSSYRALRLSEVAYYEQNRFGDVWVQLARAPATILRAVESLPGVAAAEGRVVADAVLDVPGVAKPATGLLISIPAQGAHTVDDVYLRQGRHVESERPGEVMVNAPFAEKNALKPGDSLHAVVAGRRIELKIVGIALSPEYVMQMPPGALGPDDRRFGVFWMEREQLASLLSLQDGVNDIAVRLTSPRDEPAVIAELDRLFESYGGRGAFGRSSQGSHVELENHIDQLRGLSLVIPAIFLLVAAFLVNVVLGRLVNTQRSQIGMLKAFGYSNARLAGHYLQLALAIVSAGIVLGVPIGLWLGRLIAEYYATFFRFPVLILRIEPAVIATAAVVTIASSLAGAWGTLLAVAAVPPVVAMASPAPVYRPTFLDRASALRAVAPALRMIVRNLTRRPMRAVLTTLGMAMAVAILVLGGSSADSLTRMIDVQFQSAQREDLSVVLAQRRPLGALHDFSSLPGVRRAEPYRSVPARLRVGGRTQDVALLGLAPGHMLRRIVNARYETITAPPDGLIVNVWLARRFNLHRGDTVAIEIREGQRRFVYSHIVGLVDEPIGSTVYLDLKTLDRLLGEPDTFNAVHLRVDPRSQGALYALLKNAPQAISVADRRDALENFRSMADTSMAFIRQIEIVFSVIIAFGVVYNAARIALAERGHELATLRVLGFTRREVSSMLLGEVGLLALGALPFGFAIGYALSAWVASAMSNARFRMPVVVEPATYAFAVVVFAAATVCSALVVRRRLDRLDLVAVLKARE